MRVLRCLDKSSAGQFVRCYWGSKEKSRISSVSHSSGYPEMLNGVERRGDE